MMSSTLRGMWVFSLIWIGQLVSILGSGLSEFALSLWVYQQTGSVTQFAFVFLFKVLPTIVLSPFAGVLVDRWDRRWTMILSDVGAALGTLLIALLLFSGRLEIWHVYAVTAFSSAFKAFQLPAYLATTTLLVPPKNLGRANGLVQIGQAASEILVPALAGILVATIQVRGVILIDFVTFLIAVITLLLVRLPRFELKPEDQAGKHSLRRDVASGLTYIAARPGLVGLLIFSVVVFFLGGMINALLVPMMLEFTSVDVLGLVLSIAGSGLLLGSLALVAWGGPQRRLNGMLGFGLLFGICILLIGARASVPLVALSAFGAHFAIPFISGFNQAIWQSKVALNMQGRVFAMRQMITLVAQPIALVVAGPLADRLFEPLLSPAGLLAGSVGRLIGVGRGRGIGLLFVMMGVGFILTMVTSYMHPRLRHVEDELPDVLPDKSDISGSHVPVLN